MTNAIEMCKQPSILVVEDDLSLREALVDTLTLNDMDVKSKNCAEDALLHLSKYSDIDLIVSDVNMGLMSGYDLLVKVKRDYPHIPVLLITAYASISESVRAMKEGAVDYLVKPFEPELLVETVQKVIGQHAAISDEPIAEADSSRKLLQLAARVAQSESTVLLLGESGTGKEVLAKYVHDKSPRASKSFIAINCAAIPENMLEAMLFGHEKGAYTGAHASAPGKFEQANGGTLLLDEISEMDLGLQAKLLRVLQEREVERLGGRKSIKLDVRVIATSNRDMRREVAEGKFREDLYFRLSVLPLQWAPLRDRKEDITPLAKALLTKHAIKQKRSNVQLCEHAMLSLRNYPWPGNVRELDNVMQRALILQPGEIISSNDLGLQSGDNFSEKPSLMDAVVNEAVINDAVANGALVNGTVDDGAVVNVAETALAETITQTIANTKESIHVLAAQINNNLPHGETNDNDAQLGADMKRHEFEIIVKTLRQENGSKKNTAERLGISPRTLRYKLARLREQGYSLESAIY